MNIVFASVDSARPDAFTQRFFSNLQSRGSYYDTCIVQAPFTSPSHVSMMTGLYPFNHGVRWLIDYYTDAKMLPDVLGDEGFNTAGFTGGYPLPTGNLGERFDSFEHHTTITDRFEGRQEFGPANVLTNRAINWLSDRDGEDNFAFLHFFDLHFTLRSEFGKRDQPDYDDQHVYENVEQYIGRQKRRYYDEADFVGQQLGRLDELVEVDLWIVTADHGSKMPGDHGYPWVYNAEGDRVGSQFRAVELYDELVRVPLILAGDHIPDRTVHKQVRSIDIAPTLLDAIGHSLDQPDGLSLLDGALPEFAYSETYHGQLTKENRLTYRMDQEYEFGWNDIDSLVSLRSNEWKLICTANGDLRPTELYHIAQDSSEYRNRQGEDLDIESELFERLQSLVEDDAQRYKTAHEMDEETRNHLEDLGYL